MAENKLRISSNSKFLIFSDLDGCFLDHHDYQYTHSIDQARTLEDIGIPLIFNSSKTRSEITLLCTEIGNHHPFIIENGAAVLIPENYFNFRPKDRTSSAQYEMFQLTRKKGYWLECIASLKSDFRGDFVSFQDLSLADVMDLTGLVKGAAIAAMERQFSEPVMWLGSQISKTKFINSLQRKGATVTQGGRFLSVGGNCDKGRALKWLRDLYAANNSIKSVDDLAIGDSENDLPMLEAAMEAVLIRSPGHKFPTVNRADGLYKSKTFGPRGWTEEVSSWLKRHKLS